MDTPAHEDQAVHLIATFSDVVVKGVQFRCKCGSDYLGVYQHSPKRVCEKCGARYLLTQFDSEGEERK